MREGVRLQKVLSTAGLCSRRDAEKLITAGRVRVDGLVVTQLGTRVDSDAKIAVDGVPIRVSRSRVFLFHKPRKVVTTLADERGRRDVSAFIEQLPIRVFPVGRLDRDVNGLIVLTNDGDFAERLLHPKHGVARVYLALVEGVVTDDVLERMRRGIHLSDGRARAESVEAVAESDLTKRLLRSARPGERIVRVRVSEGRNHFVKRLLGGAGLRVRRLCRTEFGPFRLGRIKPGQVVELREIPAELKSAQASKAKSGDSKRSRR